jgi:hypothetical protein
VNKSGRESDWHTSPAHLDLLSKFTNGRDIAQVMDWQYLKEILSEPAKVAIDQFIAEGALVPCTLQESLGRVLTVAELKELLRERGLQLSGRKADLIDRLVQADRRAAEEVAGKRRFMKCSPESLELLDAFEEERKIAEAEAKANAYSFLVGRNVRDAYREYVECTRRYRTPDLASSHYQAEELGIVLSASPDALSDLDASDLVRLQAAVAMSKLWRNEDPVCWLPDSFPTDIISPKVAVLYLMRSAEFKRQVSQICECGSRVRMVFSPYDFDSCDLCKKYDGKEFTQADFPNLPLRGCTSETGCTCELEAVWEDAEYVAELDLGIEEIGQRDAVLSWDPVSRLHKLKELLDLGLVSQEEYDQKKAEILKQL